jgi:hypothetical protein
MMEINRLILIMLIYYCFKITNKIYLTSNKIKKIYSEFKYKME